MSFTNMSEKQLKDRMRFLSDKMESIWEKVSPQLKEFDECKNEFVLVLEEMEKRNAPQTQSGKGST